MLGEKGSIIELDGRRPAPVVKSECPDPAQFHLLVSDIIRGYAQEGVQFTAMALVPIN